MNNGQDVSGLRQPLTYEAMRGAGLWAPRTSYATLTVNKEAYGFYLLEESFTKAFVHERSGDDSGAAYEAGNCQGFVAPRTGCQSLPDFYPRPFNPMAGAGEELSAICAVLSKPADQVLGGLSAYLDVGEWARALAADLAIAGDYDGFSTNGSNFRLYHDTRAGRLRLIIYGPDTTYDPENLPRPDPLAPAPEVGCSGTGYRDVFLEKLTGTAAGLEIYQKEVRALRQGLMSPAVIKARADALWRAIGPLVLADPRRPPEIDPEVSRRTIDTYMTRRVAQLVSAGL
jgi:hypothetical protein